MHFATRIETCRSNSCLILWLIGSLHGLKVPIHREKNENNSTQQEGIDLINYKNPKFRIILQLFKCLLNRALFSNMEICSHIFLKIRKQYFNMRERECLRGKQGLYPL